jgi:endonuclease/exonuclease/phosphatase family metal-dependent hydrolase
MRTRWMVSLVLAGGFLCSGARSSTEVRVLTYNIHHGEGRDGRIDLDRIVNVICSVSPDIVCLQEVDRNMKRTGGLDMPSILSRKLDMWAAFGPNLHQDGGQYGNLTLTRYEILWQRNITLPCPEGTEQRGCLTAGMYVAGQELEVMNTHLALEQNVRKDQASVLTAHVSGRPTILAGDMNEETDEPALRILRSVFMDTWNWRQGTIAHTFRRGGEGSRIDFVLASRKLNVISCRVVSAGEAEMASDHLPYLAVLELGALSESAADRGVYDQGDERIEDALIGKE